jgi:hypothetical protein
MDYTQIGAEARETLLFLFGAITVQTHPKEVKAKNLYISLKLHGWESWSGSGFFLLD